MAFVTLAFVSIPLFSSSFIFDFTLIEFRIRDDSSAWGPIVDVFVNPVPVLFLIMPTSEASVSESEWEKGELGCDSLREP